MKKKISFQVKFQTDSYLRIKSLVFATLKKNCFEMLRRIFAQESVRWAEINTITKSALIYFEGPFNLSLLKAKLSVKKAPVISRVFYQERSFKKVKFFRVGRIVTNWEIIHELPERIRLRHPLVLKRELICHQIEKVFFNTPGIVKYKANPWTGSVLIIYKPKQISKERIIHLFEEILAAIPTKKRKEDVKKIGNFELATASFGLTLALPEVLFLTVPVVLVTGLPIFKNALQALQQKKIKVDLLDTVVIGGCLAANQVAVAAFMVWAVSLAEKIHKNTSKSTEKLLGQIFSNQPQFAWLKQGQQEVQVAVANLQKQDIIVVHTGEAIPVDGLVVEGKALVDQSALTGESQPVEKLKGDNALAGTMVITGSLCVKVETKGEETVAGKIQKIIIEASRYKTKAQSKGEAIADKAVIPTLALGGIGLATGGPSVALAVVNSDYGTGIRVAAPTLLLAHLTKLAKQGVIVKNGEVLDKLSQVEVFLFDKTGTLTNETPEIMAVTSFDKKHYSQNDILKYAAAAEQYISHPIAKAILKKAKDLKLEFLSNEGKGKCLIGLGVETTVAGLNIKVGSLKYIESENIALSKRAQAYLDKIKKAGQGAVLISINNLVVGLIRLKTLPREDAYQVIQYLKSKGIKETVLISGDREEVTRNTARELGVDKYYAGVLPHEKANYVRKYKQEGKIVAMVGDGVNDGPALALADVAISLRGASDIAANTANIIFMDGNFAKINLLFESAHQFNKGVWSSFHLIAIPNTICILGALGGLWGLGTSLVLNNFFNVLATVKSLGPLYELNSPPMPKLLSAPKLLPAPK